MTPASILIRATTEQTPLLRALFCEVLDPLDFYSRPFKDSQFRFYTEERFAEIIAEDADAIWLAFVDGVAAGFSVVEPDCDLWWFSWIGVTKRSRGHGLGEQLTANALSVARTRRIRKISCVTRPQNVWSISILREAGFEKVCDLKDHWYGQDYLLWQIKP